MGKQTDDTGASGWGTEAKKEGERVSEISVQSHSRCGRDQALRGESAGVSTCRIVLFRHQKTQAVVWNGVAAADVRGQQPCPEDASLI